MKYTPEVLKRAEAEVASIASGSPQWDNTAVKLWSADFTRVAIPSRRIGETQNAYFRAAQPMAKKPLIVSLHTWSGDYTQWDPIADQAALEGWNYIHPDFQGANDKPDACLSPKVLEDIDDAIEFAIANGSVDLDNIFVVGASGGGHAALGAYLATQHRLKAVLSWVPITDLNAWYQQSLSGNLKYAEQIAACVASNGEMNAEEAARRSPLSMPLTHLPESRLELYAGFDDGHAGSVPISHSILFFNRMASELGYSEALVEPDHIIDLLTRSLSRNGDLGSLDGRAVIFERAIPSVALTIFDGAHEMLPNYCFARLQELAAETSTPPHFTDYRHSDSEPTALATN